MELFLRLLLGHMVGDYILQTGSIAQAKNESWQALLLHVSIVSGAMALATIGILSWPWWLCLGLIHLLIDGTRTYIIKDTGRWGWLYILADQTAHLLVLWFVAFRVQPETLSWTTLQHPTAIEVLTTYTIGVIFLIWTVPVLEVQGYAALARKGAEVHSSYLPITRRARLTGAVERLAALLLLSTPLAALVLLVFLPNYYRQWQNKEARYVQRLITPSISLLSTLFVGSIFSYISLPLPWTYILH